jgi:hypothetical protein
MQNVQFLQEISEKVQKILITPIMKRLHGLQAH